MTINEAKFEYYLRLGDSSLILGHRISEWCGHGPILEEDIALINVALDLVGQSRFMLDAAGKIENKGRTEDNLAYFRNASEYRNALLCEQPNGDFANTIVRQFFYDTYHFLLLTELTKSKDETLAAYAEKALKEVSYHLRHSQDWLVRLGDGTTESNVRTQNAVNELWMYTGDLFDMNEVDALLIKEGVAVDLTKIKLGWDKKIKEVLDEANLTSPENQFMQKGSKAGIHTEQLSYILAEMQSLARALPDAVW
ncbi:MAG: phenylacetate-CoA oxygenase subunit PaaC [Bacteroidetes bacterium]|nr:phenylacetate-CoA oxygenase subunit PaaC [Bacteroidota bacterium]MBK9673212.1 phenylacetate-CoA oxygenase subunit PaaC [Bacteroidota bacterium]MBK9799542.1 phenylacetate-CoA oxygenase subunit PaaC [Bacteroidota bacterium]MBP6413139.1 phenylacetate-CoA oxygenase subunit PaaC [Bacteroidia bacterium]